VNRVERGGSTAVHRSGHDELPRARVDATLRAVMAGICPFCDRGPFKVLAGHTARTHGVDRLELRVLAGLTYSASILDDDTREEFSARAKARLAAGAAPPPGAHGNTRRLSPAGKRIATDRLRRLAEQLGPDGLAKQRAAAARRHAELSRKPHPCPVCGTMLPTAHPMTCSPRCRRVIRVRTARASATKRLEWRTPDNAGHPPATSSWPTDGQS
jgi:predicted nucleic acid-binding Zn ribbon protein